MKNQDYNLLRRQMAAAMALGFAAASSGSLALAQSQPSAAGGGAIKSTPAISPPASSPSDAGGAVPSLRSMTPARVETYYGDSPAGSFASTARSPGASPNVQDYGPNPSQPVMNPNNALAVHPGPVANGTAQPLTSEQNTIAVPVEETGEADNPQESASALVWISIAIVVLIGSIWGLIKWTQPGGQV